MCGENRGAAGFHVSKRYRIAAFPHLEAVTAVTARPGQPDTLFRALDAAMDAVTGHKLFTILVHRAASGESERRYTNRPTAYPVGGRTRLPESA
jgi:hypothetical protein